MITPVIIGGLCGILLIFVFLAFFPGNAKSPPRYSWLLPSLTGQHDFKSSGILGLIRAGYKQMGDCFSVRFLHTSITFLIGPEAQGVLFGALDKVVTQRDVYKFTVPVFGKNIVYDAPLKVMNQQLRMLKHGLSGDQMKQHGEHIMEETVAFFGKWTGEGEIDLFEKLSELTIMTASRCLLGQEIRNTMHAEVAKLYHSLNEGMTPLSFFFPNFPCAAHKNRDKARDEMVKRFSSIINKRRTQTDPPQDFLQTLIDAKYSDGKTATAEEISGLLLAGLFAGQHTSSITSTWTGLLILTHAKELLPRLLAEQKEALASEGGKLTLEAISKMELLGNCVKETLRMYPPLILLDRKSVV